MVIEFDAAQVRSAGNAAPAHVNPILWQQSQGLARQICARVFRDGGKAADALTAFGLKTNQTVSWDKAVEMIAEEMSRTSRRKAA